MDALHRSTIKSEKLKRKISSTVIMMLAVVILSVIAGAFAAPPSTFGSRIVGGHDAAEGQFPYQISLRYRGSHNCGGSIIDSTTILTAAHCIVGFPADLSTVIVGTNDVKSGGTEHKVTSSKYHPQYNLDNNGFNDIGILKVSPPISFNNNVKTVALGNYYIGANQKVTLSGWGLTSYPGSVPQKLQYIDLKTYDQGSCKSHWSQLVDTQVCTLTKTGEGACKGDSGGPLVDANGVQIGIVSQGNPCAKGVPDIYTRVSPFISWINSNK